jgi:hypothetical protein
MATLPPIKNTSGEGFAVEDACVALLACHLLAEVSWPGASEGTLNSIQCQMRQDGWLFDDAVLYLERGGRKWRCACSIKSFDVFGKEGAPIDFTEGVWDQWLDKAGSGFTQGTDSLALIAAQHAPDVREAWFGVCDSARQMASDVFAQRFTTEAEPSPMRRAAFESLMRVATTDSPARDPAEVSRLLASFRLFEHDFQHAESRSAVEAMLLCQQALADAERNRARELWDALILYCSGIRRKGGQITLPGLLDTLAYRFSLKQHPRFSADWTSVLTVSRERMSTLPTKIGGKSTVPRAELLDKVNSKATAQAAVVILGEAGNGKSALASRWAGQQEAVWVDARDLVAPGGLKALFGLTHGVSELFASASQPTRLVMDGLDRCFDEAAFGAAAQLLRGALSDECRGRWQVALTCRPEDWERVRGELARRALRLPSIPLLVDRFSDDEAEAVCRETPELFRLWQRRHLQSVLKWPKALDLVAAYSQPGEEEPNWTSESDFSRWFWEHAILQGERAAVRGRVCRKLAVRLADRMIASAPIDEFPSEETDALEQLQREGFLEIDKARQRVHFSHDLIADWMRQHELAAQGASVAEFLQATGSGTAPRLQSALWHHAVRGYGLALLEHSESATEWQALFDGFDDSSDTGKMVRNLLLQAPVFSLEQRMVLERLRPVLEANSGALLQRFLREFLRAATVPDEEKVNQVCEDHPNWRIEAAASFRLPWVPYWRGVLGFLAVNPERAVAFAQEEVAGACLLWLPLHGVIPFGMGDAAKLAISAAHRVYRDHDQWYEWGRETSAAEKACQALLAAAPELPAETANLALKLSGRRPPAPEDILPEPEPPPARLRPANPAGEPEIPSVGIPLTSFFRRDPGRAIPWPEGPLYEGAEVFTRAFLSPSHCAPFIRALPEVAAEVMFAVLLNIPRENRVLGEWDHDLDERGFSHRLDRFRTPLWTSGPFLMFLQINPEVGLPAIIRLVNFATERATELREDYRARIEVPVKVDGQPQIWRGHQYSCEWHQGHVFGPRAVGCALVCLEKWLYTLMDAGKPLEPPLATIVRESRSIALAALLICVGKKKPELFLGALRPLVEVVEFYWMDETKAMFLKSNYGSSAFYDRTPFLVSTWREWMAMPHRKEPLGHVVAKRMVTNPDWRRLMEECRPSWLARIDGAPPENPLPYWFLRIVAQLNPANWRTVEREGKTFYLCDTSAELPEAPVELTKSVEQGQLLGLIPFQCSEILAGKAEITEEQIADWWAKLDALRKFPIQEEDRGIRDREDAVCGIIAVAVVKHRSWLATDQIREQMALEILADVGENQPPRVGLGNELGLDFKWDVFAAWALTTLWCEQPENPFLLQAVGALALCHRNLVSARVMAIAAQHRVQLGERFDCLLSHVVRYAPILHRLRTQEFDPDQPPVSDKRTASHLDEFLAGQTKPLPDSWQTLAEPQKRQGRKIWQTGGIDIGYLAAVTEWAEDLSLASTDAERQRWLNIHRQTLLCTLHRAEQEIGATSDPTDSDERVQPYQDDERILKRAARVVANLPSVEDHAPFWEPIFALGCRGARWVESFVFSWFIEAACREIPAAGFIEQWLAMLNYAEGSADWHGDRRLTHASDEMWKYLLGLTPFTGDFWSESLAAAINAVWPFYERWIRAHARDNYEVASFLTFMRTRAALSLRIDSLCLLHETVPLADHYFWDRSGIRDSVSSFLQLLFDEHWAIVAGTAPAREAFMAFALKLNSLQHPAGSELHAIAGERLRKAE